MSDLSTLIETFKNCGNLLPTVYKDLAQPGVRKVGRALETVLDTVNSPLLLLRLANEKAKLRFEKHMEKYRKKLEYIEDEKVCDVPPEIGIPILERLTYTTNDDIAELFINILTKASSVETLREAHPSFIHIVDRLSQDEAKLVNHIKYAYRIEYLTLNLSLIGISLHEYPERLTGLEFELKLDFPENMEMCFNNLMSLGLLEPKDEYKISVSKRYDELRKLYEKRIEKMNAKERDEDTKMSVNLKRGYYRITKFGNEFVKACTG